MTVREGFDRKEYKISNELNFSGVYRSVNWVASKVYRGSFTLHATQCSLHFDKPLKNEIHSLNKCCYS